MDKYNVYQDIGKRTGGDLFFGVVGPVRTGKSTFIKRFMELVVLPEMDDPDEKQRTRDELPQSASGRLVMTRNLCQSRRLKYSFLTKKQDGSGL